MALPDVLRKMLARLSMRLLFWMQLLLLTLLSITVILVPVLVLSWASLSMFERMSRVVDKSHSEGAEISGDELLCEDTFECCGCG